jgi:hypothetical protein
MVSVAHQNLIAIGSLDFPAVPFHAGFFALGCGVIVSKLTRPECRPIKAMKTMKVCK